MNIWNAFLLHPLINLLVFLVILTGNLGLAIIALTIGLRLLLTPLILPSLKLSKKMAELTPQLSELKSKYPNDKQALMLAQAELYKKNGVSPAAGCLPQIVQLVVLIALFNALNTLLHPGGDLVSTLNPILYSFNHLPDNFQLSSNFLYLNLLKPDLIQIPGLPIPIPGLFLLASAAAQFVSAKMLAPVVSKEKQAAAQTKESTDDAMVAAQQQMIVLFPLMTIIFGFQFPSGLVLYWLVFSLMAIVQQYLVTGWGGFSPVLKRVGLLK